jgi:hypothetical protein
MKRESDLLARGTTLHLFRAFISEILVGISADMKAHCRSGIDESSCLAMQQFFAATLAVLNTGPAGLRQNLKENYREIRDNYKKWNDEEKGSGHLPCFHREKFQLKLTGHRKKIRDGFRRHSKKALARQFDRQAVLALYSRAHELAQSSGDCFPRFARRLEKIGRRVPEVRALV